MRKNKKWEKIEKSKIEKNRKIKNGKKSEN